MEPSNRYKSALLDLIRNVASNNVPIEQPIESSPVDNGYSLLTDVKDAVSNMIGGGAVERTTVDYPILKRLNTIDFLDDEEVPAVNYVKAVIFRRVMHPLPYLLIYLDEVDGELSFPEEKGGAVTMTFMRDIKVESEIMGYLRTDVAAGVASWTIFVEVFNDVDGMTPMLIDEILNVGEIVSARVVSSVRRFFVENMDALFLVGDGGRLEMPVSCYSCHLTRDLEVLNKVRDPHLDAKVYRFEFPMTVKNVVKSRVESKVYVTRCGVFLGRMNVINEDNYKSRRDIYEKYDSVAINYGGARYYATNNKKYTVIIA